VPGHPEAGSTSPEPGEAFPPSTAPPPRQADDERRRRALGTIRRVAPRLGVSLEDLSDDELVDQAERMVGDLDPGDRGRDPLDVLAEEFERAERTISDARPSGARPEGWVDRARRRFSRRPAP
jgi:hypothetical protein